MAQAEESLKIPIISLSPCSPKANALADMPDYRSEWELTVPFTEVPVGTYGFAADETFFAMTKATYRLTANASAPQHIIWYEYFNPYDGTKPGKICAIRHWNKTETIACESPETYEISPTGADGEGYYTIKLVGVEITEVVSDQIADNEANKLPSPSYGQQPNNPMLMATRTGKEAYLAVRIAMNAEIANAIWVGARKVGDPQIRGKVPAVPGTTRLHFMADDGSNLYEIVAGRGDEVVAVFQKTPKIDPDGKPYSGEDRNFNLIDRVIVITQNDYAQARSTTEGYSLAAAYPRPEAAILLGAFATGANRVSVHALERIGRVGFPSDILLGATTENGVLLTSGQAGLAHPVGARWGAANDATTHRLRIPKQSFLAFEVIQTKGMEELYDRVLATPENRDVLRATATADWLTHSFPVSDSVLDFGNSDPNTDVHLALGKCDFVGALEVSYQRLGEQGFKVGSMRCMGEIQDLYDFAYGAKIGGAIGRIAVDMKNPPRAQAGHATLTNTSWPSAGRVFFVTVVLDTDWFKFKRDYE